MGSKSSNTMGRLLDADSLGAQKTVQDMLDVFQSKRLSDQIDGGGGFDNDTEDGGPVRKFKRLCKEVFETELASMPPDIESVRTRLQEHRIQLNEKYQIKMEECKKLRAEVSRVDLTLKWLLKEDEMVEQMKQMREKSFEKIVNEVKQFIKEDERMAEKRDKLTAYYGEAKLLLQAGNKGSI